MHKMLLLRLISIALNSCPASPSRSMINDAEEAGKIAPGKVWCCRCPAAAS
jgi:hypothetical protein